MSPTPAVRPVFALTCLLLAASLLTAQTESVRGKVVDATKAPIPGTRVSAIPQFREPEAHATTNEKGEFSIAVPSGKFNLRVVRDGFLEVTQSIVVPPGAGLQIADIQLEVTKVIGTVTVTDAPGYLIGATSSATRVPTPLIDLPQTINIVTQAQIQDQGMLSIGDVVRYIPGITAHQGENNRDQVIIRGNSSSADFFVNGVRDDVQYYRDLYNLDRVEALKGPNAMTFGRGGGGGVINRVIKEAGFGPLREISVQGGSFGNRRISGDFDQPINDKLAFRLNGLYENSNGFRRYLNLERAGVNPALTYAISKQTRILVNYEYFRDVRVADRGITSYRGRPLDIDFRTFFGNPDQSYVNAVVNVGSTLIEHQAGRFNIRNRTVFGNYDRGYQNFVPGVVSADKQTYALTTYNNATNRLNIFNQTDATFTANTGSIRHTLLGGMELGKQMTDNFRNTGYFNNTATSISVPLSNPTTFIPAAFRQSATDADNHLNTNLGALYVQDQIALNRFIQVIAGLRVDHFDLTYFNNRTGERIRRIDNLVSPRTGIVIKPIARMSLYGNYSVSYLPSSGDQFSSLTTVTQQVKPEKFTNYEVGVKWDVTRYLALTTAVFRLDRTNTRSTDPNDPTRIIQTGSQRTNGFEVGMNGSLTRHWRVAGGYSYQDAFITSATTAARTGAQVGQVPHHNFSLWNNYQILPRLGAGLGVLNRSDMFVAVDNTVVVPSYTRADAALFFSITERIRLQANVENVFNRTYWINADSNTNISPGSPRAIRIGLTARF
jgi:catecholate siderophore receptor